jgi:hypothetical protein
MAIHGFQKKTVLLVLFLVLFSLDVSACGLGISEEERDAVYNLIEWNLYYARVEDLNGYMWTLHPEAPGVNDTKAQMAVIFREFDLAYDIEEWEILRSMIDQPRSESFRSLGSSRVLNPSAITEWRQYTTSARTIQGNGRFIPPLSMKAALNTLMSSHPSERLCLASKSSLIAFLKKEVIHRTSRRSHADVTRSSW